ncbi:MAG: rod shape-determining protein RodA [Chloroflexi bacterium]|nr:MAG: rod shape-determining protein RodA [Chloroflexota bacterium]
MNTTIWRDYNWVLAFALVGLSIFSITMVYSATLNDPMTLGYFNRHLVNVLIGLAVMVAVTFLDYHAFQSWTFPLYVLSIILLATVLIYGNIRGGAQSWLDFGMRTVQPSEPIKLVIILVLAGFWASQERSLGTWRPFIGSALLLGVPLLLVFIQPDFGTALVFASVWLTITWLAGITIPQIVTLIGVGSPLFYFGWTYILAPYQRTRLLIFLDPIKYDPELKSGAWNIIQSLTAIGSGGLTGQGWTNGVMSQGNYLPVQYSDFIFAITGEELGFVGTAGMLFCLGLLIWQALDIAANSRDLFGRLIAGGVAAMFLCHVMVNAGMNMSIMPITGIPLPFISYGGSFTVTSFAAVGLLQSVSLWRRRIHF